MLAEDKKTSEDASSPFRAGETSKRSCNRLNRSSFWSPTQRLGEKSGVDPIKNHSAGENPTTPRAYL